MFRTVNIFVVIAAIVLSVIGTPAAAVERCDREPLVTPQPLHYPTVIISVADGEFPQLHPVADRPQLRQLVDDLQRDCTVTALVADGPLDAHLPSQTTSTAKSSSDSSRPWEDVRTGLNAALQTGFADGNGVKVAVFDTGVNNDVVSLHGGYDAVSDTTPGDAYTDMLNHGTASAALIRRNAPNAQLYSVRVFDDQERVWVSQFVRGVDWAIGNNMDVLSMSVVFRAWSAHRDVVDATLAYAHERNIVMVAANGNEYTTGSPELHPAADSHTVAVAATTKENERAWFSSVHRHTRLAAPGSNLTSLANDGTSRRFGGTSGATPLVAAAATLLRSATDVPYPVEHYQQMLYETAWNVPGYPAWSPELGHGLVQAQYALDRHLDRHRHASPGSIYGHGHSPLLTRWVHARTGADGHPVALSQFLSNHSSQLDWDRLWFDVDIVEERQHVYLTVADFEQAVAQLPASSQLPTARVVTVTRDGIVLTQVTYEPLQLRTRFSDVDDTHLFVDPVATAAAHGLVGGFSDGTFQGSRPVTRQAFVAMLYRMAGSPDLGGSVSSFSDVDDAHPFADAIRWATATGMTTGYDDGTFQPNRPVTRQAAVAFLYRAADAQPVPGHSVPFSDVDGNHPFQTEIVWAYHEGVTSGYGDGTFQPTVNTSRYAAVTFLVGAFELSAVS